MSRADTFLTATPAAMDPLAIRHRWLWAQDGNVSGSGVTGIFADKNPALHRPVTASCRLPCLLPNPTSGLPVQMSLAFQLRNSNKLHRYYCGNSFFCGGEDRDAIDKICREVKDTIADTLREVGDAFGRKKSDTLLLKKRRAVVQVPTGNLVSERAWAKLDAGRKVSFNPRIAVVLVPTKEECYPTATDTAACFFSSEERDQEAKDISTGERGNAEWLALLTETREAAAEDRKTHFRGQLLREQKEEQQQRQGEERSFNLFEALGRFWHNIFTSNRTPNINKSGDGNDIGRFSDGQRHDEGVPEELGRVRDVGEGDSSRRVTRKHADPMSCSSVIDNGTKGQEAG